MPKQVTFSSQGRSLETIVQWQLHSAIVGTSYGLHTVVTEWHVDLCLIHVHSKAVYAGSRACKLLPRWLGPFNMLKLSTIHRPAHYRVHPTFHVSMLRRAHDNSCGEGRAPVIIMIDGEKEFELQPIFFSTDHSTRRGVVGINMTIGFVRILCT